MRKAVVRSSLGRVEKVPVELREEVSTMRYSCVYHKRTNLSGFIHFFKNEAVFYTKIFGFQVVKRIDYSTIRKAVAKPIS